MCRNKLYFETQTEKCPKDKILQCPFSRSTTKSPQLFAHRPLQVQNKACGTHADHQDTRPHKVQKTMQRQTAVTDGEKWPTNSKMYLASVQTFGSLCLPKTARGLCPHSARALVATDTRHQDARPRALAMQQLHGQDCTAVSRGSWLNSRVRSHPYLTVALSTRLSPGRVSELGLVCQLAKPGEGP